MIRGRTIYACSARHPNGEIHTRSWPVPPWATSRWRRIPFLRGTLVLSETMVMGMRALTYSAQVAAGEDEDDGEPIPKWMLAATLAFSIGLSVVLFFITPLLITHTVVDRFTDSSILSNIAEGVLRLAIFFLYLLAIGLMPSIRRVFAYHAAEHMTVHANEHDLSLETDNVRKFPAAHPRCGTAFLLTVMIVAIIVFAMLGTPDLPLRILSRIVLIPVIAGIAYEVIRYSAAHEDNALVRALAVPGLALQKLTTRPPDDDQIEVAISAMNTAIAADKGNALDPLASAERG
ncbi:MAG: DUF1385 domain-containing protein [Chloroflexi bacterium]|nr:DUF1385 domain-containing protein [Chloroflexota bacterium]MCH7654963.1 DUF1385 domain-containing protein [Chloroflexota bacterium]